MKQKKRQSDASYTWHKDASYTWQKDASYTWKVAHF